MALITKPDFTYVWASGGAIVAPNDTKKQQGWVAEAPPFQYDNWLQNRQDQMLAHINQRGIPAWDGLTNYEAGGLSYVQGSDGKVYKSVAASGPASVVSNPTTDVTDTYWTIAFADVGAFLTQAAGDTRYTQRSNNLSDLTNAVTARTNLALGTAATANVTTSATDTTAGRLMKVGDFGLGAAIGLGAANNIDQYTLSGFYTCDSVAGTLPAGVASGGHLTVSGNGFGVAVQCFVPYFTPTRSFIRTWVSPTWTGWQEIALINSPTFTGTPTAPTASVGTNTTQVATTAFVLSQDARSLNSTRIDVGSSATVNLTSSAPNTRHINITGTTTINGFTVASGQCYFVRFNASLTLTNSGSLVTQTGANITTAAGDTCIIRTTAANTVEILSYVSFSMSARAATQSASDQTAGRVVKNGDKQVCTAWVNFNGVGVVAIRDSLNVTSITDNNVGDYSVNLVSMSNANFAPIVGLQTDTSGDNRRSAAVDSYSTTAVRILTGSGFNSSIQLIDMPSVFLNIFGGK